MLVERFDFECGSCGEAMVILEVAAADGLDWVVTEVEPGMVRIALTARRNGVACQNPRLVSAGAAVRTAVCAG